MYLKKEKKNPKQKKIDIDSGIQCAQTLQTNCPAPLCDLGQEGSQFPKLKILEVLWVKRA